MIRQKPSGGPCLHKAGAVWRSLRKLDRPWPPWRAPSPGRPGCRTCGRDTGGFQIVLSGTLERPPHDAFAADFSGLPLTRRGGRGW